MTHKIWLIRYEQCPEGLIKFSFVWTFNLIKIKMSETIRGYANHPGTKWIILCNIFTCCCFSRDAILWRQFENFWSAESAKIPRDDYNPAAWEFLESRNFRSESSMSNFWGWGWLFIKRWEDRFWQIMTVWSCPQALLNNDSLTNGLKALAQCLFLSLKTEKRQNDGFDLLQKSLVEVTLLRLIWIVSSITWPTDHHVINIRFHNLAPNIIYIL